MLKYLSLRPLQLFQLRFTHFGSSENFQIFLGEIKQIMNRSQRM